MTVRSENGQRAKYLRLSDGSYQTPIGFKAKLTASGGGYILRTSRQRVLTFDGTGRLTGMSERGRGLTFQYTGTKLTRVIDSAGRPIDFSYDGNTASAA